MVATKYGFLKDATKCKPFLHVMFDSGLLNGVLEIDALNKGYVRLHVGILGFNVDVATADQCFDGAIEIRIKPFKVICNVKMFRLSI